MQTMLENLGGGAPANNAPDWLLKKSFGFTLTNVILNLFQDLIRKSKKCHTDVPKQGGILRQAGIQSLFCTNHAQNEIAFKIGTNTCHPEGEVRRISKKNAQGILLFAQNDKKCAFTLAEVLITLGIIGIIVAMTLPVLIGKYQKLVTVTKLKKAYTVLSQMVMKSQEDNGPASFSTDAKIEAEVVENFFNMYWKPYFNSPTEYKEFMYPYGTANPYKMRSGDKCSVGIYTAYSVGRVLFSTNDGVMYLLMMMAWDSEYDEDGNIISSTQKYATRQTVYVDIDGVKGENTLGKDVFEFVVDFDSNVVRPLGYNKTISEINTDCSHTGMGQYCAAKIMNDGWEIKDDYPW